jgi:hypothetical protein
MSVTPYHFLTALFLMLLVSCKGPKETAQGGKPATGESGEVEPDQLRPQIDTRFQEKFFQAQLEKAKGNYKQAYLILKNV